MNSVTASVSALAAYALRWSPTAWLKSWLLYLGIQTHVRSTIDPELKPLHNVCEYLNAVHIYSEEARQGRVRHVESHHFCSHARKDLRQCLIYDSCTTGARLIGVEYMVPKHVYDTLGQEEQKLWHSHVFEVKSGMLVLPTPTSHKGHDDTWEKLETEAMKEVVGLYGKTWHFWQIDKGHELPLGWPTLMGSLTENAQVSREKGQATLDEVLRGRNETFNVHHAQKATVRTDVENPQIHENADSWWKEAKQKGAGLYA